MARKKVPADIEAKVLMECRRRCAICYYVGNNKGQVNGQVAHLDKNNENFNIENLAWLCLNHHTEYDSTTSQHKNFTITEVKEYRRKLIAEISSGHDEEEQQKLRKFLENYNALFTYVLRNQDQIEIDVNIEIYESFRDYIVDIDLNINNFFNPAIKSAVSNISKTMADIWTVISDRHYIPAVIRWKFDNTERSDENVQAILREKKVLITSYCASFEDQYKYLRQMAELQKLPL